MTPSAPIPPAVTLRYRIDAANRLTWVNDAWVAFARANGGELLLPGRIIGRELLAAFADPGVREIYALLIAHARAGKPVRFDYRCDAPDRRRTFTMEIRGLPDGEVEFESRLREETPRPSLLLLQSGAPRDAERFVRICGWCQGVAMPDGRWIEAELAVAALHLLEAERMPRLTHGICPHCHDRVLAALGGD